MPKLVRLFLVVLVGCAQTPRPQAAAPGGEGRDDPTARVAGDIQVVLAAPEYSRDEDVAIQVRLQGSDAPRCGGFELWKTADGGTSWQLALNAPASEGALRVRLPEGAWGLRTVALMDDGARTPAPRRGDAPDLSVTVDRTPPQIILGEPEVARAGGSPFPDIDNFDLRVAYTIVDANPSPTGVAASISFDGQSVWRTVARPSQPTGVIAFTISGFYSPLRFKVRAQDAAGNAAQAEKEAWPEDLAAPPVVQITTPAKSAFLRGGAECVVRYRVEWNNIAEKPITIEFSSDGKAWQPLAADADNSGAYTWQVPRVDYPAARLRLEVKGRTGRRIVSDPCSFTIDSTPASALILGPDVLSSPQSEVHVDAFDQGEARSGFAGIVLFARPEGGAEPVEIGRGAGNERTIPVQLPGVGKYQVWAVVTDRAGNESAKPGAGTPFALRVSRDGAPLRFLTFADGGVVRAGSTHFVAWNLAEHAVPANAATLFLVEGAREIPLANVDPLAGKTRIDLPLRPLTEATLRLDVALADGSLLRARTGLLSSDADPPNAVISRAVADAGKVTLSYAIEDRGPAGLKSATLFVADDHGVAWRSAGALQQSGEIAVDAEPGLRGFYIFSEDNVGNRTPEPGPGTKPHALVAVGDAPADLLTIENITPGMRVRGGTTHYIAWRSRLNESFLPAQPARVSWSDDDGATYKRLGQRLPASGEIALRFPRDHGARVLVQVNVDTACDRTLTATAGPITVDCRAPGPFIAGPATSAAGDVVLKVQSPDDQLPTLSDVRVYVRRAAQTAWKQVPHTQTDNGLAIALADGQWEAFVGATDQVGNRTPAPDKDTPGHVILVDTVPPVLTGRRDPDSPSVYAGSVVRYALAVRDTNPAPVALSMATRAPGENWKQRDAVLPVDVPCEVTLPEKEGVFQTLFTVHDLAGNKTTWADMINVILPEPELALVMPEGACFPGGSRLSVTWTSKNPGANAQVTLALSLDGGATWDTVADNLGSRGTADVALPPVDTRQALVSCGLRNAAGRTTSAKSSPFTISAHTPEATILGDVLKR
jgi:hypothetical protein